MTMTSETPFDQAEYWIERHKRLQGDPRSVGNVGKSVEENLKGEELIKRNVSAVARLLKPSRRSVLDLGCGYGRVANEFLQQGFEYIGIDVSPDAIKQAQLDNPEGKFQVMDLNEWEPAAGYDVVCALYILVHFVDDDKWSAFLDGALRSVDDDGYFVFADEFPDERKTAGSHVVIRPLSEYTAHLSRHGFQLDTDLKAKFVSECQSRASEQFHFARRGE
jgi:SAM-dependent methyltransferase